MTYDIYHHGDFDGRASAAMLAWFLRARGDRVGRYVPIDYDEFESFLEDDFLSVRSGARRKAVLDFPFHPEADIWFDHHDTPVRKKSWQKLLIKKLKDKNEYMAWRPEYASACHEVMDYMTRAKGIRPPAYLKNLAKWVDFVDGAKYKSPKEATFSRPPALQIAYYVSTIKNRPKTLGWLTNMLRDMPLSRIVKDRRIREFLKKEKEDMDKAIVLYKERTACNAGVACVEETDFPVRLRLYPFVIFPKSYYGLRTYRDGKGWHLSLGWNQWHLPPVPRLHIGNLLVGFGGGGHKGVGGCEVRTKEELDRIVESIISKIGKKNLRNSK